MTRTTRREFLATTTTSAAAIALPTRAHAETPDRLTIIDTHTHFYDPTRPAGVPWPSKGSPLYRTVLPKHYLEQRTPAPVTGTVVVEASEWVDDNQWILDLAEDDPFIVGLVGRLHLAEDRYPKLLEHYSKNPLFRGIRIRAEDVDAALDDPAIAKRITMLSDRDLSVDLLGSLPPLERVPAFAKRFPKLRVVVDHMGNPPFDGERTPVVRKWEDWTARVAENENAYCKVSGVVEAAWRGLKKDGGSPTDAEFYEPLLGHLWKVFGEDRVIYGSNWPVSDRGATLYHVQKIVADYFGSKGDTALQKYFAGNAKAAYKWVDRRPA